MKTFKERLLQACAEQEGVMLSESVSFDRGFMAGARAALELAAEEIEVILDGDEPDADRKFACWVYWNVGASRAIAEELRTRAKELS